MTEPVVLIKDLVKKYGSFTAINGIDVEIARGELFGLLGPNGAGKTTTLECLEGLRRSDRGTLRVAGCDPRSDERKLRKKLGVQLQSSSLPENVLVEEIVSLIRSREGSRRSHDLIDEFGLSDLMKKQYGKLSTGQKRRVHLVLALLNDPEVLILDEPTAGLDVQMRAQLHGEIRSIKKRGVTILLATHDMAEAEVLCDRIAILIRGRIAACGTPEQITATGSRETRILLRTSKGSLLPGKNLDGAAFLKTNEEGYIEWRSRDVSASIGEILEKTHETGDLIEDLRVERPSLEERFLELVKGAEER